MRALLGLALLALATLPTALAGCSKDADETGPRKVKNMGGAPRPVAAPVAAPPSDPDEAPPPPPSTHVDIDSADASPVTYTVKIKVEAGATDPDLAVVESGQRAASGCFTGISDGTTSRTASIHVTVLPTGAVTRTDVSAPSTGEAWILSCLEGVGSGLRFAEKPKADIRNFTINVSVSRPH